MLIKLYKKVDNEYVLNAVHDSENEERSNYWSWRNSQWYIRKYRKLGYECAVDDRPNGSITNLYYKGDLYYLENSQNVYALGENINNLTSSELASQYDVQYCENCEEYYDAYYDDFTDYDGNHYCSDNCRGECCFYCEDCNTFYNEHDHESHVNINGYTICDYCCDDHYVCCEDCGELVHIDDAHYNEHDGCYYCDNCYEDSSIIGDYHRQKRNGFTKQLGAGERITDKNLFMGIELECECCGDYREDVANAVNDIVNRDTKLFDFEDDGSLDDGYESISQPCTPKKWQELKPTIQNMLSTMREMGCKSHDTSTCGLHIHFNRDYIDNDDDIITRLVYLFEKFKPQMQKFSRRKSYGYCNFLSDEHSNWETTIKHCKDNKYDGDRYRVVNLENYNTVEIRLFKGTLILETLYSALEFVNNIVDFAKDKTDDEVENCEFKDIIEYKDTEYLKEYCIEKNLI